MGNRAGFSLKSIYPFMIFVAWVILTTLCVDFVTLRRIPYLYFLEGNALLVAGVVLLVLAVGQWVLLRTRRAIQNRWIFLWIPLTIIGYGFEAYAFYPVFNDIGYYSNTDIFRILSIAGLLLGVVVGVCQAWVWGKHWYWWLLAAVVGWIGGFELYFLGWSFIYLLGLVPALTTGLALVLLRRSDKTQNIPEMVEPVGNP